MGSFVAQEIGLRYPRRADRLVLVASSTTGVNNPTLRDFVLPQVEGPWRNSLVAQGRSWPQDAYARTPLDADPHAVEWMKQSWDADPVAPQSLVSAIAAETARVPLGTWLGETKALLATDNTRRLRHLKIPTLVLWGAQDSIFYDTDQHRLVKALTRAARGKGSFAWKQYGARPLPASGFQESDIGHNVQWEAPAKVARDIASYLRTGRPTKDLYRTDHPDGTHHIVTEPGAARIISRR
jgi:pimeloyl-ACP methyl ester carboxylesterase